MSYTPPPGAPLVLPHFSNLSWLCGQTFTLKRHTSLYDANGLPWGGGFGPTANGALYFPIFIPETVTVVKMFRHLGAIALGNWDVGIYNDQFSRLVSSGSTAAAAINTTQVFDIADTTLTGGRLHYLAIACDDDTGRTLGMQTSDIRLTQGYTGAIMQASAFPLPATATPVGYNHDFYPVVGCSIRSLVT